MTTEPIGEGATEQPLGHAFLDLASVLARWRTFIVRLVLVAVVVAVVLALALPKWYRATAVVFPAEQAELLGDINGVASVVKSFGGGGRLGSLGGPTETEKYIAILRSETALMKLIDKFDLVKVYDITSYPREKTMKELLSNIEIHEGDGGILEVSVYDKDPQRATDMANYFLDVLNEINSGLNSQNARGNREFIEQRYRQCLEDVRVAEDSLHAFQTKNGLIALPEQLEATIKAGTEIYGKIAAREVELDVMRKSLSESHPSIIEAEAEIRAMKGKLREFSTDGGTPSDEMKILVPLGKAPGLGLEYYRLYRDSKIQNKILEFITPLYEQAKVEEQRSTPSVVVLDRAVLPERKAKPKITVFALIGAVGSFLAAMLVVFAVEGTRRLKALDPARWETIWGELKRDWFGLRKS